MMDSKRSRVHLMKNRPARQSKVPGGSSPAEGTATGNFAAANLATAAIPAGAEATVQLLFDSVAAAVAYFDRDCNYLHVNQAYVRASGLNRQAFTGQSHFALFPNPQIEQLFRAVLSTGQPYTGSGSPFARVAPLADAPASADAPSSTDEPAPALWNWSLLPVRDGAGQVTGAVLTMVDLGALEQTERALRETRLLFEHLFEATSDANVLVDAASRIVLVNHEAEHLFGYARAELVGQPVEILVPEASRREHNQLRSEYMRSPVARPMAVRQSLRMELTAQRKDGSALPVEVTLNPIQTGDGVFILAVVRDITQRRDRERELSAQTELTRLLQDVATAANEADSIHNAFQFTTDRICRFLGWPVGRALLAEDEKTLAPMQVWSGSLNERYADFKAASEAMRFEVGIGQPGVVLATGQPSWLVDFADDEQFIRRAAAQTAGLRTAMAMPVIAGKEVVGVLEFFHEQRIPPDPNLMAVLPHIGMQLGRVVERLRAEERLRKAVAQLRTVMVNLPVFVWVIDRNGRLLMMEGKRVAAAGIDPLQQIGRNVFAELSLRPDLLDLLKRVLTGEEVHTELVSAEGAVFEAFFTPYFDMHGTVDGIIGLAFDVSERKRLEAELEEMKPRLMDSIDSERERLSKTIHDGPLQDLFGAFYQMQEIRAGLDEANQPDADGVLQTIQQVTSTLQMIVGELHPNTLVHLGLQRAIHSHATRLQERTENGIALHLDLAEDRQMLSHATRLGLYRIYQQLFNNAINHSGARHVWVRLRLPPRQVVLEVQDNGRGFQVPTHWVDLLRQGKYGLANSLERAHGLGGELEIRSRPGRGTLVRVIVPRENAAENTAGAAEDTAAPADNGGPAAGVEPGPAA